jgi:hypothetical protein
MTTVSHGILHLSTPIVPGQPPRGVPDRCTSHVLHMALNELFDALGLVSRALTNPRSLIMLALTSQSSLKEITFAEIVVLRSCRAELERWCPKWLVEIQSKLIAPSSSWMLTLQTSTLSSSRRAARAGFSPTLSLYTIMWHWWPSMGTWIKRLTDRGRRSMPPPHARCCSSWQGGGPSLFTFGQSSSCTLPS